ncbi:hypothetical protein DFH06DRAFT_576936 [Mycena polygramma]|nr:hypothetical protein DFH06DRAFT_576936 [Mycena polygramma]
MSTNWATRNLPRVKRIRKKAKPRGSGNTSGSTNHKSRARSACLLRRVQIPTLFARRAACARRAEASGILAGLPTPAAPVSLSTALAARFDALREHDMTPAVIAYTHHMLLRMHLHMPRAERVTRCPDSILPHPRPTVLPPRRYGAGFTRGRNGDGGGRSVEGGRTHRPVCVSLARVGGRGRGGRQTSSLSIPSRPSYLASYGHDPPRPRVHRPRHCPPPEIRASVLRVENSGRTQRHPPRSIQTAIASQRHSGAQAALTESIDLL